jgi:hypothetical protein
MTKFQGLPEPHNREIDLDLPNIDSGREYRCVSVAGTVAEPLARLTGRANIARNLAIPRATGMPSVNTQNRPYMIT